MKAAWSGRLSAWRIKALIGVILGTLYAVLTAGRVEDADYAAMSCAGKSVTGEMGTGRRQVRPGGSSQMRLLPIALRHRFPVGLGSRRMEDDGKRSGQQQGRRKAQEVGARRLLGRGEEAEGVQRGDGTHGQQQQHGHQD